MKKKCLLIVLFLCFYKNFAQEPIQESFVSKTLTTIEDEWQEVNYSTMVNVFSNRKGILKIVNAEFLTQLSGGKAIMLENSAYNMAELTYQTLTKEKTDKNGLLNLTYEGKLLYKCHQGSYVVPAKIIFIINQADIIGLRILNMENRKEYLLSLEIKG